jgi:hypothetical protein
MITKLSSLLRSKINSLLTLITTGLIILLILNSNRLFFEINPNISLLDLINTKIGLLNLLFLSTAFMMYSLNAVEIKTFSKTFVEEYVSWFFTSLSTIINYLFYRFSVDLYTILAKNLPIDILYQNSFITVKRVWAKTELVSFLNNEVLKYKNILLSIEEKNDLIDKAGTSAENLIFETRNLCDSKLNELPQDGVGGLFLQKWQWDWLFETTAKLWNYVYAHPVEVLFICLAISTVWAGVQNFFYQKASIDVFSNFQEIGENLNTRLINTDQQTGLLQRNLLELRDIANFQNSNTTDIVTYLSGVTEDIKNLGSSVNLLREANLINTEALKLAFRILDESGLLPIGMTLPTTSIDETTIAEFVPFSGTGYRLGGESTTTILPN